MSDNDERPIAGPPDDQAGAAEFELRMSRGDQWAASADERERLADERERLADERDALADERERLADRHDHVLDGREIAALRPSSPGPADDAEVLAAQAALRRAEDALERATAHVIRAQQAALRAATRAARRTAGSARADAADLAGAADNPDERVWLADRRDFVAVERGRLADEREITAQDRETAADLRDRQADRRELEALHREHHLDQPRPDAGDAVERPVTADRPASSVVRRRTAAGTRRQAAARWGPDAYGPMLLASFAQLAQQLFGSDDLSDALPKVLKYAAGAVAGCDWAAVTVLRRPTATETIASGAPAAELDELQFGTGIGPSIEALRSGQPAYVPGLADSPRWPVLAATAAQLGVASVLCRGLFVHHAAQWSALGTLSLYSATPDAFSDDDHEFAAILAAFIAVATAVAQRRDDVERREAALHRGLSTRDVIGQAKGILMERQHLSAGDAFDLLRRASQRLNRKLAEVAQYLADTGELPK